MSDYFHWEAKIDDSTGKTRRPDDPPEIDNWAKRANVYTSFKRVIERFQDNIIVLSYRDGGLPDKESIRLLLSVFKKRITIHSVPKKYVLSRSEQPELLFIAR